MEKTAEVWEYDGSFAGFMTVVLTAFNRRQFPGEIYPTEDTTITLFVKEMIETQAELAQRIFSRLQKRLTASNLKFIQDGFYSSAANKEVCLLEAIEIALQTKDSLENFIGQPAILNLQKAIKALYGEAHLLTGFLRFEYVGNILFGKINPKHFSLPYICPHFAERYPMETLMIYDETRQLLAVIEKGQTTLMEGVQAPNIPENTLEREKQEQWRTFLEAVTIKERINPRAQMSHLPLRFRSNMVDFN